MNTVKGLKNSESTFLNMEKYNKYKFSFVLFNPDTSELQSKNWGMKKFYLEDWLSSYELNYSISERERTGKVWYMGRSRRKPVIETEKIDWRWTIYNIKVIGIKSKRHYFKITFKVKLTPKEAYILGESLKNFDDFIEDVVYKKIDK